MKATNQKEAGFTLTELLVVLGCLALLTATLLPALAATKLKELSTQCLGNLRQLAMTASIYQTENNSIPLVGVNADLVHAVELSAKFGSHSLVVPAGLRRLRLRTSGITRATPIQSWAWNVLSDPNNPTSPWVVTNGSYGLNGWFYQYSGSYFSGFGWIDWSIKISLAQLRRWLTPANS